MARKKLATDNATFARKVPILVNNIKSGNTQEYNSIPEASKELGVSKGAVSQALLNNRFLKKNIYNKKKNIKSYIIRKWIVNVKTI